MTKTRYDQCDDTCTTDCGHCKGHGKPAQTTTDDTTVRPSVLAAFFDATADLIDAIDDPPAIEAAEAVRREQAARLTLAEWNAYNTVRTRTRLVRHALAVRYRVEAARIRDEERASVTARALADLDDTLGPATVTAPPISNAEFAWWRAECARYQAERDEARAERDEARTQLAALRASTTAAS